MTDQERLDQIAADLAEVKATVTRLESVQKVHGSILQSIPKQIDDVEVRLIDVISSYAAGQSKLIAQVNQLMQQTQVIRKQMEVCRLNDASIQRQIDRLKGER